MERTFRANLRSSIKQIQADRVQNELGYDGSGVVVGILDSGIDYTHDALGGGFGDGFQVCGGFDFVNDDADPMDDFGHGTLVAGIVGAKSEDLTGVAPGVSLFAVKVLDSQGYGLESDILAAIDYCLDPDGNPATDDAVDILNMSFGGSPRAEDPIIKAVDNATRAGVLCVAASGNSGNFGVDDSGFETIGSPAAAKSALAVSACDAQFILSPFSAKGPTPFTCLMKPELLAPGEDITSTWLNNSELIAYGTSMAAPHVAGVAALLKQQNPDWTPQRLKATLVNSGDHVNPKDSPYAVGNGCVNAWTACTRTLSIQPGMLNFSPVELSQPVWQDTLNFIVTNKSTIAKDFALDVKSPHRGITLDLSTYHTNLEAGGKKTITAILQVASSVPIQKEYPFGYTGAIFCISDGILMMIF
ncbi:S8 family serine peptidase [candidate division KSB1 bacterium]|nr:S8 family serine peptidase [candidate division KSB1 bacterium]